jgi:membrane associated rhomboid family serine protease
LIPIGDDNTLRRRFPFVNYTLILVNIAMFVVELGQVDPQAYIARWGAVPARISQGQGLETLLTSTFLHAGWWHLLGNMLFLYVFGDNVEDAFGHLRYLFFYLVCGVLAGLGQIALAPTSTLPGVGASGAISGVLAAYLVMFGTNRVRVLIVIIPATVPAWLMIGVWIALQVLNGAASIGQNLQTSGGIAYGAHVGGFAGGLVLSLLLRPRPVRSTRAPFR